MDSQLRPSSKEDKDEIPKSTLDASTKKDDTVFEITLTAHVSSARGTDDKKENGHQTLSVSALPNIKRKIDFVCINCSSYFVSLCK